MQVVICLSCMLAFMINYSVFLNTTLNSALTHSICGNLKVHLSLYCLCFLGTTLDIWFNYINDTYLCMNIVLLHNTQIAMSYY